MDGSCNDNADIIDSSLREEAKALFFPAACLPINHQSQETAQSWRETDVLSSVHFLTIIDRQGEPVVQAVFVAAVVAVAEPISFPFLTTTEPRHFFLEKIRNQIS
jgi:hypothetical protein